MSEDIEVKEAHGPEQLGEVRELFTEYVESLGFDLDFQDYEREYAELPGEYAPPDGCLLLAYYDSVVAGCVALRKFGEGVCEMKRLYVWPESRRKGVGKALTVEVIDQAKRLGYEKMMLDTVPSMVEAITLYRSLGFKECEPYRYNPVEGAVFMELAFD